MEKNQLLKKITERDEERITLAHFLDQLERSARRNVPAATHFLTPQEQSMARSLLSHLGREDAAVFAGGYEGAERQAALFLPDYLDASDYRGAEDYPLCAVRCTFRGEDRPSHRDFLGSLMGLGIRREMVGDLLVGEESCDILLKREVLSFVLQNYTSAGRTRLRTAEVSLAHLHLPEQQRQTISATVAALRLDNLLAAGFRISRSRAAELIRAGRVEVNWRGCGKVSAPCAQGDVFSVRGMGKCTLAETGGLSKKGRITVRMERYR